MGTTEPLRAIIYARVSKDDEGKGRASSNDTGTSDSIHAQVTAGKQRADAEKWLLIGPALEDDGISGFSGADRAGFNALLRHIARREIDVVIVRSINRLSRNDADGQKLRLALRRYGVKVQPLDGPLTDLSRPSDDFMFKILQDLAELESNQKSETLRISFDTRRQDGTLRSSMRTYGWVHSPGEPDSNMTADTDERRFVRAAYAYMTRESLKPAVSKIVAFANDPDRREKHPKLAPVRGGKWTHQSMRELLMRPANAGFIPARVVPKPKGREETTDERRTRRKQLHAYDPTKRGGWEPLVPEWLYVKVRSMLDSNARRIPRGPKPQSLLGGIAVCHVCELTMTSHTANGRPAYRCRARNNPEQYAEHLAMGPHPSPNRELIDADVRREIIRAHIHGPADLFPREAGDSTDHLFQALDELNQERSRAYQAFKLGGVALPDYTRDVDDMNRREHELRNDLAEMQASTAKLSLTDLRRRLVTTTSDGRHVVNLDVAASVGTAFDQLAIEERRAYVRALLNVRTLDSEKRRTRWIIVHKLVTKLNDSTPQDEAERLSWRVN